MLRPPVLAGAVHETAADPSPATPAIDVGALGLDRNEVNAGYSELVPKSHN